MFNEGDGAFITVKLSSGFRIPVLLETPHWLEISLFQATKKFKIRK